MLVYTTKPISDWSFNSFPSTITSSLNSKSISIAKKEFIQLELLRENARLKKPVRSFTSFKIWTHKKAVKRKENHTSCLWRTTWISSACSDWKLNATPEMHCWFKNWGTMESASSWLAVNQPRTISLILMPSKSSKITASHSMLQARPIDK